MNLGILAGGKWLRSVFTCTRPRTVNGNALRATMVGQSVSSRLAKANIGSTTKKSQDGRARSFSTHRFALNEGGGNVSNSGKTSTPSSVTTRQFRLPESSTAQYFHSEFLSTRFSEILNSSPYVLASIVCLRSMSGQEVTKMLLFAESTRCCSHRLGDVTDCLWSGFSINPISRLECSNGQ